MTLLMTTETVIGYSSDCMGCNASLEHWDYSVMVEVWAKDLIFILW